MLALGFRTFSHSLDPERTFRPLGPALKIAYARIERIAAGLAMKRREFITLIGGAVVTRPVAALAQQPDRTPTIGLLFTATETFYARSIEAFREGMRQLGYDEGRNIRFVYRFADGYFDRLPGLAAELILLKPSVIVAYPLPAILAVHRATTTIPIVAFGPDPVGFGLAESLSHPGGNVTGIAVLSELLAAKQLDFARELLPQLSRAAILINVRNPIHVPQLKEVQTAAADANVDLVPVEVRGPDDLEKAFATLALQNVDALLVSPDIVFLQLGKQIADLAASHHLPAVYGYREHVIDGGLLSYGPDIAVSFGRVATYVDKILKGGKPANLPVERPTKFELVINLKTARALGLDVPLQLQQRADEVIE